MTRFPAASFSSLRHFVPCTSCATAVGAVVSAVGAVNSSSLARFASASSRQEPHISGDGCSEPHTAGRSGEPKIRQRYSRSRFTHGTPATLPSGIPGIGDDIEGAMQHAPQPGRHSICALFIRLLSAVDVITSPLHKLISSSFFHRKITRSGAFCKG